MQKRFMALTLCLCLLLACLTACGKNDTSSQSVESSEAESAGESIPEELSELISAEPESTDTILEEIGATESPDTAISNDLISRVYGFYFNPANETVFFISADTFEERGGIYNAVLEKKSIKKIECKEGEGNSVLYTIFMDEIYADEFGSHTMTLLLNANGSVYLEPDYLAALLQPITKAQYDNPGTLIAKPSVDLKPKIYGYYYVPSYKTVVCLSADAYETKDAIKNTFNLQAKMTAIYYKEGDGNSILYTINHQKGSLELLLYTNGSVYLNQNKSLVLWQPITKEQYDNPQSLVPITPNETTSTAPQRDESLNRKIRDTTWRLRPFGLIFEIKFYDDGKSFVAWDYEYNADGKFIYNGTYTVDGDQVTFNFTRKRVFVGHDSDGVHVYDEIEFSATQTIKVEFVNGEYWAGTQTYYLDITKISGDEIIVLHEYAMYDTTYVR